MAISMEQERNQEGVPRVLGPLLGLVTRVGALVGVVVVRLPLGSGRSLPCFPALPTCAAGAAQGGLLHHPAQFLVVIARALQAWVALGRKGRIRSLHAAAPPQAVLQVLQPELLVLPVLAPHHHPPLLGLGQRALLTPRQATFGLDAKGIGGGEPPARGRGGGTPSRGCQAR